MANETGKTFRTAQGALRGVSGEVLSSAVLQCGYARGGDVIKSVDGVNVSSTGDLLAFLQLHPIMQGDVVGLEVERNGQVLRKTLTFPVIPMKQPLQKRTEHLFH